MAYIDPITGKIPEFTTIKVSNETECEQWLNSQIKQGERYVFGFSWKSINEKDIPGHIVNVWKNKNNQLEFYDSQIGINYDKELLHKIKYQFKWYNEPSYPRILRVDNKKINYKVLNFISKPAKKIMIEYQNS